MSTEYTLTYFDARGRAEHIRMILAYGGAKWKDNRVAAPFPDDLKARLTYGQVPLLEFDGKILVQSATISRFLAKQFKLTGKDEFEAAKCDEVADACSDILQLFTPSFREKDPEKKAEGFKTSLKAAREKFMTKLNEFAEGNGGHLVGKGLTWADINVVAVVEGFRDMAKVDLAEGFPALEKLIKTVNETKGIKEYLASQQKK